MPSVVNVRVSHPALKFRIILVYLPGNRLICGMRLQGNEIKAILRAAREIYGSHVKVYLFGSRLDDTKRGGDIDLLIRNSGTKQGTLARIRLIARLKCLLGDRKIDVIGDYEDNEVVREALEKGVLLV